MICLLLELFFFCKFGIKFFSTWKMWFLVQSRVVPTINDIKNCFSKVIGTSQLVLAFLKFRYFSWSWSRLGTIIITNTHQTIETQTLILNVKRSLSYKFCMAGMHNSGPIAGQKIFFEFNFHIFERTKTFLWKKQAKFTKIWASRATFE